MATTQIMKVSRNGQVSIPAAARARWHTERVVVVDLGDHIVMRPAATDPSQLIGKYAGHGPSSETQREEERTADDEHDRRRR